LSLTLDKLVFTSPTEPDAIIDFDSLSHLIFGPTDSGKSFIVEAIQLALGGNNKLRDIGYSEPYTLLYLHVKIVETGQKYTFLRGLTDMSETVYREHVLSNIDDGLDTTIQSMIQKHSNSEGRQILTKAGTLGNLTAADLRRLSLFDEIATLNLVPFEGVDTNRKVRNRSALSLTLSGKDDSQLKLAPKTDDINKSKGKVEILLEQIEDINQTLPKKMVQDEVKKALQSVENKLQETNNFLGDNKIELNELKLKEYEQRELINELSMSKSSFNEAIQRFLILKDKYKSDIQRLEALQYASILVPSFEEEPCPMCKSLSINDHHDVNYHEIASAAKGEINKIKILELGLIESITEIEDESISIDIDLEIEKKLLSELEEEQTKLTTHSQNIFSESIEELSDRKVDLIQWQRDFDKLNQLSKRLEDAKANSKRQKQVVDRDLSSSSSALCTKVASLLEEWGVPEVSQINFNKEIIDIEINQRSRISYGKGKRGIFLSAYIIALMEIALEHGFPHLGLVVIDSPVVTYKDPKYGSETSEELLDISVKDEFYNWLVVRKGLGQVIVLENEDPSKLTKPLLNYTEFVGNAGAQGRKGLFPS